jgi:hypothetical protein
MEARDYAEAIDAAARESESRADALVANLVKHLKAQGRIKLLPAILRELKAREARTKALAPRVEVAREKDAASALKAAHAEGIEAKEAAVNPALLSGWRGMRGGKLVDRSGKRALVELYRNITG